MTLYSKYESVYVLKSSLFNSQVLKTIINIRLNFVQSISICKWLYTIFFKFENFLCYFFWKKDKDNVFKIDKIILVNFKLILLFLGSQYINTVFTLFLFYYPFDQFSLNFMTLSIIIIIHTQIFIHAY